MGIKVMIKSKALNRQIAAAAKRNPEATTRAVMDCILDLSNESMQRAPVETGDLRSNCHGQVNEQTVYLDQQTVSSAVAPTTKVHGTVGYSLPYALRQHEDLSLSHDRTDGKKSLGLRHTPQGTPYYAMRSVNLYAGGEAKYLEKPFSQNKEGYVKHIKKAVIDSIGKHT